MTCRLARVCVVEDDPFIALDLSMALEDLGYDVAGPFHSLRSAMERCAEECFDCALLDVNLGDGQTSESIAEMLRRKQVPFAFVTAYSPDAVEFRQPSEPCVTKPFNPSALKSTVEYLLS